MKVLLTGAAGQVGAAVRRIAPSGVELLALRREELDIVDRGAVQQIVSEFRPDLVINAAAYTAVDKAESEPEAAAAVNADGAHYLAEACVAVADCRLIHLSTDYVFDGTSQIPYKPEDATNPISVYGRTKLAGERAVLEVLPSRVVVLRTAWVYAAEGGNFLLTMLRLMRERSVVRVVADQTGSPTSAASIAEAIWRIAQRPQIRGVLHWTDAGTASWYDFAVAIAADAHAIGLLERVVQVTPIKTADYPTLAQRPAHSALDFQLSARQLAITPELWRENLGTVLAELMVAKTSATAT